MFERFLSFFGFVPGLSGLAGMGGSGSGAGDDGFESEGEAKVSFQPGAKITTSDDEETADERRGRITDRDLVWPGKTETIQISNPEPVALRFDLTVTDLDGSFYIRRPATGGAPQREGGVLLQPGQDASFDVIFVPPPGGDKTRSKTFSFVLTCFDPRRSADPGEIVQDLPLRWVALPSAADLQITAQPPYLVLRPWRREARFALKFQNKSFLPPSVGLTLLRAPTKDALDRGGETVGTIEQALPARTPGAWQCVFPPAHRRGSYYATVRGAAQTAQGHSTPLLLPKPVVVRYVPWLRMGRDWLFLLGMLLFLFWLAWGVPVRKTPIVRVSLAFAGLDKGQIPTDGRLEDLTAQMVLTDERGHDLEGQTPIPGVVLGNAFEFTAPPRWYGYRWAFGSHIGWNGFSRVPQHFRVTLAPAESEKSAFKRYDLNTLLPDGNPVYDITKTEKPYEAFVAPATYVVQSAHGVFVNLRLGDLGALTGKDLQQVTVAYALDGAGQAPRTFQLLHDGSGQLRPLTLDLTDLVPLGSSNEFTAKVTADGLSSYDAQPLVVHRQDKPFTLTLAFPKSYPRTAARPGPIAPIRPKPAVGVGTVPGGVVPGGVVPGSMPSGSVLGSVVPGSVPGVPHPTQVGQTISGHPIPGHPIPGPVGQPGQTTLPLIHPVPSGVGGITPPHQHLVIPAFVAPRLPTGPPPAPSNLTAYVAGPSAVSVRWTGVPGIQKYVLYRSIAPGQSATGPRVVRALPAATTTVSDTGLAPGTIYLYRIQSKYGKFYSSMSARTAVMTQAMAQAPATVVLNVAPKGHDLQATLDFTNVSQQPVYLDRISGCLDGKIGDDLFQITADGQPIPFSGRKTDRPSDPGPRQFVELGPGETTRANVNLSRAYRLPPGTHTYNVTYLATHNYPARLQRVTLHSATAQCVLAR